MRSIVLFFLLCGGILFAEVFPTPATDFSPRKYTCHYTLEPMSIDGKLSETDWQKAAWTENFVDIEGDLKSLPYLNTKVKLLYNDNGIYLAAELKEPHIWANLTQRDDVIFRDNDFEIFIDPNGDTHEYYELELNALGTLWDLFILKPYRDQHSPLNGWDMRDIAYGIDFDGTINDPSDIDRSWTIEMFLPFASLSEMAHMPIPPKEGDFWRINFSRVQWETEIKEGKYLKKANTPEHNWVWSPQGLVAMHYPERWGYLFFSNTDGDIRVTPEFAESEYLRDLLRQLYYKQKQYFMDHGHYAKKLKQLDPQFKKYKPVNIELSLETTSQSFLITQKYKSTGAVLHIREDGLIW